ncbi:uncharacterized protein FIESC28_05412 [Fusarium coffeatum]|uniref:Uncharacterized protein n=1 Tax=Fusarium coffeatum TaxID=231269 RepID=A0A366RSR1_9HYPO|nr:uncharacterized protein FIESC28_05412 [Fusarium coffeatum]RBR20133.1 hypothetical protein FIESC28_05412 [Fusarium coffeatum]
MHHPTILTNVITLFINMALAVNQKYDVDVTRINYNGDDYSLLSVAPSVHTINRDVEVTELKIVSVYSNVPVITYPMGNR